MTQVASSDGDSTAPAGNASHPPCPSCGEGALLPLNSLLFWVCTTPSCTDTISGMGSSVTYDKGHALTETKEKDGKRWAARRPRRRATRSPSRISEAVT